MPAEKHDAPRGALRPRSAVSVAVPGPVVRVPVHVEEALAAQQRADEAAMVGAGSPADTPARVDGETLKEKAERMRALTFPSANRKRGEVPLSDDFERVTLSYLVEEPYKVYQQLERELDLGDQRDDRGSVRKAADRAESNARLAHRLWMTARVEERRWELENEATFAAMRTEATAALQREKVAGDRSKQITDADVTARACAMYPDEYRAQEVRKKKVDGMVKSCENLSTLWNSRCRTLQELHSKQR